MSRTLPAELLLLAYDGDSGKPLVDSTKLGIALAGAAVVELAATGGVQIDDDDTLRRGSTTVDDPMLADVAEFVDGRKAKDGIQGLSVWSWRDRAGKLREHLLEQLAEDGVLTKERHKILGILPTTRWVESDGAEEAEIRRRLRAVVLDGETPDERTAALVGLASAIDLVPKLFPDEDAKAVTARAVEVREGDWGGSTVKASVDRALATLAVLIAVPVFTTVVTSS